MSRAARYSGQASKDIWARIAAISHEPAHSLLQIAALALREHEQAFLQMLVSAESYPSRTPQEKETPHD